MKKITVKDLIKPKKPEVEGNPENPTYGKFVIEPLERGFGLTIGNALRRVLLSSLQGAAVTSVKFDTVMHEFATVPGVVEDVSEIILNLKEIRPSLEEKDRGTLRLSVQGPKEVKASDFTADADVVIANPGAHIASLAAGSSLDLEITVKSGRNYVPAELNKEDDAPAGTIFIDSMYSPVTRCNYSVSNSRVGKQTDFDKLVIEIWTDGTIDPGFALSQASYILTDQLTVFVGDDLVIDNTEVEPDEPQKKFNDNLFRRIDEIELSVRSANCLENADIKYMGELVQRTEAEMLRTKNFGRKSLNEIKEILSEMGLSLGMKLEDFPNREELEKQHSESRGLTLG